MEQRACIGIELRRDDHIGENFRNDAGEFEVERAVANDHAAEGCLAVGFEGFLPCDTQVFIVLADAAGVGVLEDRDGRTHEVEDQVGRGFDVEDVGVGKLLALDLGEELVEVSVERALLVRVVAVAELLFEW